MWSACSRGAAWSKKSVFWIFKLIFLTIVLTGLAACNLPRAAHTPTPFPTLALFGTVEPTLPPLETPAGGQPTTTPALATPEVTTATPGQALASETPAPSSTAAAAAACTNQATFITDVTIPDGSVITPGAKFTKTWRVRNDGTCTWGTDSSEVVALAFSGGSRMGGPSQVNLPVEVAPGDAVKLSVNLVAPISPGTYTSKWEFLLSDGSLLGLGKEGTAPLTAVIRVLSSLTRITFNPGATSDSITGKLSSGGTKDFVVNAQKSQVLIAQLTTNNPAGISLLDMNGQALPSTILSNDGTFARSMLPATQDYLIEVTAGSQDIKYTLDVTIPSRINFQPGAISATVKGSVFDQNTVSYILGAQKGQTMTVSVSSSAGSLVLDIYGLEDGKTLVGASEGLSSWSGKLPADQDYVVQVVPDFASGSFTLKTKIN